MIAPAGRACYNESRILIEKRVENEKKKAVFFAIGGFNTFFAIGFRERVGSGQSNSRREGVGF